MLLFFLVDDIETSVCEVQFSLLEQINAFSGSVHPPGVNKSWKRRLLSQARGNVYDCLSRAFNFITEAGAGTTCPSPYPSPSQLTM